MMHPPLAVRRRFHAPALIAVLLLVAGPLQADAAQAPPPSDLQFTISVAASAHSEPITGRMYVLIDTDSTSPALSQRSLGHQPISSSRGVPFFAIDIHQLEPGQTAVIDASTPGFPQRSLRDLPPGDYFVQALVNVYTEFHRADGHVIWAHMDQWDGQHFNWAPGNLLSAVKRVRLDPVVGYDVALAATEVIPPIEMPPDDEWVKRVRIQSDLLSEFWGHPIYIGATVLLPKGYDTNPNVRYPTVYQQGHFDLRAPFRFQTTPLNESPAARAARLGRGVENGYEFYQAWNSPDFPRMFAVTFQHPTPYFDDSYTVNSANNGPYADAILTELIPYLEQEFRMIPESYARLLTGGSTGGYEALALQVHHPTFFGGTWVYYPDTIDFRRLFLINIYEDENAFLVPGWGLGNVQPERYAFRSAEGQSIFTIRDLSRLASMLGSKGRSTDYLEAWEASFGPVGDDGYTRPLWDKQTGKIDREVAQYWREEGYDLRYYTEQNWSTIGQHLVGKLHFICGDMDNYFFNQPVYMMEEFLEGTTDPYYAGSFRYGRPNKPHGWTPITNAELMDEMAALITQNTPAGHDAGMWRY